MRNHFLTASIAAAVATAACGGDGAEPSSPPPNTGGTGATTATGGSGGSMGGAGASGASACNAGPGGAAFDAVLSEDEVTKAKTLSPLPAVPPNTTNKYADNAKAAALGQMLFFDKSYSGPLAVGDDGKNGALGAKGDSGRISCQSCHLGQSQDDQRTKPNQVSLGADYGTRNALTLVNASHYKWTNWAGRFSAQWELPLAVAENPRIMNGDRLKLVHTIFRKYRAEYEDVFGALEPALGTDSTRFPASAKPKANAMAADGAWEAMAPEDREIVNVAFVN